MSFLKKVFGRQNGGSALHEVNPINENPTVIEQNAFLRTVTDKQVPPFTLAGYCCWAKPVRNYDGDSVQFVFFYNNHSYQWESRVAGIDTAEIKGSNDLEKEFARMTKRRLKEMMGDDLVYLECGEFDKYGRLLVTIFTDSVTQTSINQQLIDDGLAYAYDGGTKREFSDWCPGAQQILERFYTLYDVSHF